MKTDKNTEIETKVKNEEIKEDEKKVDDTEKIEVDVKEKKVDEIVEKTEEKNDNNFDMNKTVDGIIKETPDISEHVFEANKKEFNIVDDSPNSMKQESQFDPSIHRQDAEGKPVLTKDGNFWRKRGKTGANKNSSLGAIPELSENEKINLAITEQNKAFSKIAVLLSSHARNNLGGEKATQDEREYLESSLCVFLDDKNIVVSSGVALSIAFGGFFSPLATVPLEKNVLAQIGLKLYAKFSGISFPAQDKKKEYDFNGNEKT